MAAKSGKRLFLAVDLPNDIKKQIHALYEPFIETTSGVSFVGMDNLHMTLSFIGELTAAEVDILANNLKHVQFSSFPLQLKGTSAFLSREGKYKNIYFSVYDEKTSMHPLANDLCKTITKSISKSGSTLQEIHLTIGYAKQYYNNEQAQVIK
jgi:2'-5' RNA ligase